ncbi:SOS response-associated peptidase family protein [Novosphingobium sp. PASSN1]|uniref:SOS response-associated peptidase n=1 Tax=Novosphingobium sp. PASSN1 TaxID=2015561 RepID=UPI0025F9088C|nr:SOS response-associated peptidase family protein [Novosphingobium sp. PASSN1]
MLASVMCNLYRMTAGAQAIAQLFRADAAGRNLPALAEIYPDSEAPVVVADGAARRLDMMRWGWPPFGEIRRPITNVRNLASPMWRSALADPARRCLVPVTAFSEWSAAPDPQTGRKRKHWFDVPDDPLFAFAGLWRPAEDGPRFAFLTCAPNETVGRVHPKAMPVILRPGDPCDRWLSADGAGAAAMQVPLGDAWLREIAEAAPQAAQDVQGRLL